MKPFYHTRLVLLEPCSSNHTRLVLLEEEWLSKHTRLLFLASLYSTTPTHFLRPVSTFHLEVHLFYSWFFATNIVSVLVQSRDYLQEVERFLLVRIPRE